MFDHLPETQTAVMRSLGKIGSPVYWRPCDRPIQRGSLVSQSAYLNVNKAADFLPQCWNSQTLHLPHVWEVADLQGLVEIQKPIVNLYLSYFVYPPRSEPFHPFHP